MSDLMNVIGFIIFHCILTMIVEYISWRRDWQIYLRNTSPGTPEQNAAHREAARKWDEARFGAGSPHARRIARLKRLERRLN